MDENYQTVIGWIYGYEAVVMFENGKLERELNAKHASDLKALRKKIRKALLDVDSALGLELHKNALPDLYLRISPGDDELAALSEVDRKKYERAIENYEERFVEYNSLKQSIQDQLIPNWIAYLYSRVYHNMPLELTDQEANNLKFRENFVAEKLSVDEDALRVVKIAHDLNSMVYLETFDLNYDGILDGEDVRLYKQIITSIIAAT